LRYRKPPPFLPSFFLGSAISLFLSFSYETAFPPPWRDEFDSRYVAAFCGLGCHLFYSPPPPTREVLFFLSSFPAGGPLLFSPLKSIRDFFFLLQIHERAFFFCTCPLRPSLSWGKGHISSFFLFSRSVAFPQVFFFLDSLFASFFLFLQPTMMSFSFHFFFPSLERIVHSDGRGAVFLRVFSLFFPIQSEGRLLFFPFFMR